MTTRETYFKGYMVSDKPQGMFYYTLREDGKAVTKPTGWFDMNPSWHEKNIELMTLLEKQEGFMFWNIGDECDEWLEKKSVGLEDQISAMAFVQREPQDALPKPIDFRFL